MSLISDFITLCLMSVLPQHLALHSPSSLKSDLKALAAQADGVGGPPRAID